MEMKEMKKQKRNRLPSTFLALALVLSLLPVSVLAAEPATITGLDTLAVEDYSGPVENMAAWLNKQTAGVTVTTTDNTTLKPAAFKTEDYDLFENPYALRVAAVPADGEVTFADMDYGIGNASIPSKTANLEGGSGTYKLLFVLYRLSTQTWQPEVLQTWTSDASFHVKATKVTFAGIDAVRVGAGDSAFDLLAGVSAQDESGNPLKVYLTDDGGFDVNGALRTYTVTYGTVRPDTIETVTAKRQVTLIENTVWFSLWNRTADYPQISACIGDLMSFAGKPGYLPANSELPEKLRSDFFQINGTAIDASQVTLKDDGGYIGAGEAAGTYSFQYEITLGEKVFQKTISVNVLPEVYFSEISLRTDTTFDRALFYSTKTKEENTVSLSAVQGDTTLWLYRWLQSFKGKNAVKALGVKTLSENDYINLYNSFGDTHELTYNRSTDVWTESYAAGENQVLDKYITL